MANTNLNKVLLIGRLTREPEIHYSQSGAIVCSFGLAINRFFKSGNERREEKTFIDVTAFGNTAKFIGDYVKKGNGIFIEGRLSLSEWTGQDGQKRSKLQVIAENVQAIRPNNNGSANTSNNNNNEAPF